MSKYGVFLTDDALRDLQDIYDYIATHDSPASAEHVLSGIETGFQSLNEMPERGNYPPEMSDLGIHDFRERFFKPYRIIYRIIDSRIYILLIADGRRDMRSLLERRLLS